MALAQNGDETAYRTLLAEISGPIKSFCQKKVGFLGVTDDVVQEGLIAIHRARHTFIPGRKFSPWMWAVVRYSMIDYLRSHSRFTKLEDLSQFENVIPMQEQTTPAEKENQASLLSVMNELPEKYREVLHLTKIEGRSVKEVSAALGVSESAVKVRTLRGIELLKKKASKVVNE
jgi:RNA polymerase sigma-70 factor (ECF subfamily)